MKGGKELNGLIENAVMLIRGIIRTINYHIESSTQEPLSDESPILPLVEHEGSILSRCQKRSRRDTAIRNAARQEVATIICPTW